MTDLAPSPETEMSARALFDEVYTRLKAMARRQRSQNASGKSLCTTELVHELYLRMNSDEEKKFATPAAFFSYAAKAMRHILIDVAVEQMQLKRGGDLQRVSLSDPAVGAVQVDATLALQLDFALRALELDDARAASVVELHFFAGLDLDQVAGLLGIARRTVDRDWRFARAFLAAQSPFGA